MHNDWPNTLSNCTMTDPILYQVAQWLTEYLCGTMTENTLTDKISKGHNDWKHTDCQNV